MMNSSMSVNAVKEGGVGASLSVEVAANSKAATEAKPSHQRLQRGKSAVGQVFAAATQLGQRPLKIPRFGLEKSSAPRRASTSMELTALTAGESMSVGVDVSMNAAAVKVEDLVAANSPSTKIPEFDPANGSSSSREEGQKATAIVDQEVSKSNAMVPEGLATTGGGGHPEGGPEEEDESRASSADSLLTATTLRLGEQPGASPVDVAVGVEVEVESKLDGGPAPAAATTGDSTTTTTSSGQQTILKEYFRSNGVGMTKKDGRVCCKTTCSNKGYDAPSTPQFPPKPIVRSTEDMMAWADDNMTTLEQVLPHGALQLLADRMEKGTYSTAFSGVDCPGTAMMVIAATLSSRLHRPCSSPRHLSAVEIYGPSQRELLLHPSQPRHLFTSVESFWTEKALQQIYDMEMDEADEGRMRLGPAVNLAKSKGVVRLKAQCACHEKECRLLRAHMHAAGIPCISWSPMGRGEGVSGADFKFFVAWAATRRSVKEVVLIWECSDRYDPRVMESFLGDLYIIWQVRLNSSDFAAVANRRRMYGICLLREEALGRFGSLDNVIPLFFRTRESFGFDAAIRTASQTDLDADLSWAMGRPKSRAHSMKLADVKASQNPHLAVLTAKELEWVENYEADYGPYYAYNLSQNPRVIGMKSTRDALGNPTLFALLKSGGLIWYNDRFYTPSEFITELFCAYCQTTEELIWSAADAEVLPPMKLARWKLQPEAKQKATAHRAVPKPKQSTNSTKPSKKSSKIVKAKVGKGGKVIKKPASASASSSSKTAQK